MPNIIRLVGVAPRISSKRLFSAEDLISLVLILPLSYSSRKVVNTSVLLVRFNPISSISRFKEPASAINNLWRICLTAGLVPLSNEKSIEPRLSNSLVTRISSSSGSVALRIARLLASLGKFISASNGKVSSRNLSRKRFTTCSSMMLVECPLPKPEVARFKAYILTGISPRSGVAITHRI